LAAARADDPTASLSDFSPIAVMRGLNVEHYRDQLLSARLTGRSRQ
jgi:hypothetical protein